LKPAKTLSTKDMVGRDLTSCDQQDAYNSFTALVSQMS
jgi:hypothetical protein